MKINLQILWSWWSIPTPRIWSKSEISKLAREVWHPYKKNSSCLWIPEIHALIDCPEDISDSLNKIDFPNVKHLFLTHWHPDHTFWLRVLLSSVFDPIDKKIDEPIQLYFPKKVYQDLRQHYPSIDYFVDEMWFWVVNFLEHWESVNIWWVSITTIWYSWEWSWVNWYLIESNWKRALYSPCETILFEQFEINDLDILITECWVFSFDKVKTEISFPKMIKNIERLQPKKTYITHIEEVELARWGYDYLQEMKEKYSDIPFEFALDWLKIDL